MTVYQEIAKKADTTTVNSALSLKANSSDVYTKTQTYSKAEVDSAVALKADQSSTYTKTQVDSALGLKADKTYVDSQIAGVPSSSQFTTLSNRVTTTETNVSNLSSNLANNYNTKTQDTALFKPIA